MYGAASTSRTADTSSGDASKGIAACLDILENRCGMPLGNLCSQDIEDGIPKFTIGLAWSIVLHWQINATVAGFLDDAEPINVEKALIKWCQLATQGYEKVEVLDLTRSWSDGLAFNALIHYFRPDLFSYKHLVDKDSGFRLTHAFHVAWDKLGVDQLLDAQDMTDDVPDRKSVMVYLACLFEAFQNAELAYRNINNNEECEADVCQCPAAKLTSKMDICLIILKENIIHVSNVVDELKKRDGNSLVVSHALLDPGQHNMVHPGTTNSETSADECRTSSPLPYTATSSPAPIASVSKKTPKLREPPLTTNTPSKSESVTAASATPNESTPSSASKDDVVTPAEYLHLLRCLLEQISQLRVAIETGPADMLDDVARESYSDKLKEEGRQVCEIQEGLTQLEEQKDRVTLQASQETASRMRSQLDLVLHEWSKLIDIHTVRQKQWRRVKDQWRLLQVGLAGLTSWLDTAETTLARARDTPPDQAEALYQDLEASLSEQHGAVAKVNSALEEVVQNSSIVNADRLRETLLLINSRWKALCADVMEHQSSDSGDVTVQPADFSQEMDDLYAWIDETENLIGSSLRPSSLYLEDLLEKIKDKKDEIANKQTSLFSVNSSGSKLLHSDLVTDEDRENIQHDMDSLNSTWNKVTSDFPERIRHIEEEIKKVRILNEDIDAMQKWIVGMRASLERQTSQATLPHDDNDGDDDGDANENGDNDDNRDASSYQITSDAIEAQQAKLSQINASYQTQLEACGDQTSDVVDSLQMKVARMNADFEDIKNIAMKLSSAGSAEINEVMEQATARQAETCTEAKLPPSAVSWPEFEKSLNELYYWLSALDHMIRSQKCRVGNAKDIRCKVQTLEHESNTTLTTSVDQPPNCFKLDTNASLTNSVEERVDCLQHETRDCLLSQSPHAVETLRLQRQDAGCNLRLSENHLRDMSCKRSQLDQAAAIAAELQKSASDADMQALVDKTEKLKQDWEQAVKDVTQQKHELDKMLEDSTTFDQSYSELELWLGQTECQLDALETQLEDNAAVPKYEELQEAVSRHKLTVDSLRLTAEKLVEDYPDHDTHQMQMTLLRLTNRWSVLLKRLQEQQDVLQTSQDGRRFKTALHEFEVWLETAEKSVQSLAEHSNGFDVRNKEEPTKQLLERLCVSA